MPAILTVTLNPAVDIYTSVPRLAPAHKLRCSSERRDPGGGGINVARVIARLGGDVTAIFPAGGPVGDHLQRLVHQEDLNARAVPISGVTRENFTVLEEASQGEYRFVLPGPALTQREFETCVAATSVVGAPAYVVASGSLPPGAPSDAYARFAAHTKKRSAKFVLDASGQALQEALEEGVYLVKPNLSELQELVGAPLSSETDLVDAARSLIASDKAQVVAITRGADGALLAMRDEVWTAQAIKAPIMSSVGAGDSFLAGLVWSLARGDGAETALRHALAAGAATLLQPGTTLCRKEDVDRLAPLATVRRL
jgi:6-phosphofructokinase 2